MYNPTKFNYVKLSRETIDGTRKYLTPDQEKLPSVTTILDATKPQAAVEALNRWRKQKGTKVAAAITLEASSRGTRMHNFLEEYVKTGSFGDPGENPYSLQSHIMANTIANQGLVNCNEIWGAEVSLYFPKIYAGTTDLVGLHNNEPSILDYKQTNKLKKREWIDDYFIQLTAYAAAHNEVYGTDIKKGVVLMCSADNVYQEFIVEGAEFQKYSNIWWQRTEEYYKKFL